MDINEMKDQGIYVSEREASGQSLERGLRGRDLQQLLAKRPSADALGGILVDVEQHSMAMDERSFIKSQIESLLTKRPSHVELAANEYLELDDLAGAFQELVKIPAEVSSEDAKDSSTEGVPEETKSEKSTLSLQQLESWEEYQ
eukprot:CAMPEP_0185753840 /NCGR_PEP_ID=MMETSP1174-20130828/12544_1 /TAXON_ID=35687 /ORGANISM="Dictyocha speculum, Strain CCMP1381" /LENGTH=143 /DNA_ID=CAMNT_0028431853 /DNA_START=72 /DNA_END=500 /DNA_ORIENTATION=-